MRTLQDLQNAVKQILIQQGINDPRALDYPQGFPEEWMVQDDDLEEGQYFPKMQKTYVSISDVKKFVKRQLHLANKMAESRLKNFIQLNNLIKFGLANQKLDFRLKDTWENIFLFCVNKVSSLRESLANLEENKKKYALIQECLRETYRERMLAHFESTLGWIAHTTNDHTCTVSVDWSHQVGQIQKNKRKEVPTEQYNLHMFVRIPEKCCEFNIYLNDHIKGNLVQKFAVSFLGKGKFYPEGLKTNLSLDEVLEYITNHEESRQAKDCREYIPFMICSGHKLIARKSYLPTMQIEIDKEQAEIDEYHKD